MQPPPTGPGPTPVQPVTGKGPRGCVQALGLTCSTLMLLFVIAMTLLSNAMRNPANRNPHTITGAIISAANDTQNGMKIVDALHLYYAREGAYPKQLTDLVPLFISDKTLLHSVLDPNADPDHVSWVYTQPSPSAGPETVVLRLSYVVPIPNTAGPGQPYLISIKLDEQVEDTPQLPGKS